jgi:thiol-disulfide isomerase/thioredoxin
MKKLLPISILFTFLLNQATAQEGMAYENVGIGSPVPDFPINIMTNEGLMKKNIKDYRGKVIILEFWATFCGPCIPATEHLEKIQRKMQKELKVFSITDEERWKVANFVNKHPTSLSVVLDVDKSLNKLFYHQFMPHTVIIDTNGIVKALTSPEEITEEIVYLARSGVDLLVKTKAEFAPAGESATALSTPAEDKSIYKVAISQFKEGLQSQINKKSEVEYEFVNCTVPMIYQMLYQSTKPQLKERACLEVTEQTKYLLTENYQYCLSLKVPEPLKDRLGEIGMRHLEEVFAIKPKYETRTKKVYALVINKEGSKQDSLTRGLPSSNIQLRDFLKLLKDTGMVDLPIVNESGLSDDTIVFAQIPKEVGMVGESLGKLGFRLQQKTTETGCLVLHNMKSVSN